MWVLVLPTLHGKPFPNKNWRQKKKTNNNTRHDISQSINSSLISIWQLLVWRLLTVNMTRRPQPQDLHGLAHTSVLRTQLWSSVMTTGVSTTTLPGKAPSPGPWYTSATGAFHTQLRFFPLSKAFNQNSFRWLFSMDRIRMAINTEGRMTAYMS